MKKRVLKFDTNKGYAISDTLHGIFFEDINFAADGGLNANMVNNYSFDGVYFDQKAKKAVDDELRFWNIKNGSMQSCAEKAISENSRFARIKAEKGCVIENLGYNGARENKDRCAISVKSSSRYIFECICRGKAKLDVAVVDENNNQLTSSASVSLCGTEWQKVRLMLVGEKTAYGKLAIACADGSEFDIDVVSLMDGDYWNSADPKWRHGKLRKDLVEALVELKPKFVRFPGGCIVEGACARNEYNWKDTVGELWQRKHNFNLWAEKVENGSYCQTYQIGFYEYFCLCEDLGAKPLPTLFAGLNCQVRTKDKIDTESPEFKEYVTSNYLDLIEFANGDPEKSEWAKLRADMGHPEPFGLDRIGIGNENFGKEYLKKYTAISSAIREKHPEIICVMSAGLLPFKFMTRPYWKYAKTAQMPMFIDEHSYHSPEWFFKASKRFDKYPRNTAKVYFGEYAANGMVAGKPKSHSESNSFESAISEAAMLTGLERNGDVVGMSSYAPLFCLEGGDQWVHNLIDFNPAYHCKSANYFVQKMFSTHCGNKYVPFDGKLPKDVYCSASADDEKLYIKIVNAGKNDVSFELNVSAPDGEATRTVIACGDRNAVNRIGFEGEGNIMVSEKIDYVKVSNGSVCIEAGSDSVNAFAIKLI